MSNANRINIKTSNLGNKVTQFASINNNNCLVNKKSENQIFNKSNTEKIELSLIVPKYSPVSRALKDSFYTDKSGNKFVLDKNGNVISCSNKEISNIYNNNLIESKQYGASQIDFKTNVIDLLENEDIMQILKENFPDASMEDYTLYLNKISEVGCGYTALANTIFEQFKGREKEFKEEFGYSMYRLDKNGNIDFNYETLILDIFTWYWHDFEDNDDITKLYQNASEDTVMKYRRGEKVENALGCFEDNYYNFLNYFSNSAYSLNIDYIEDKNWIYDNYEEKFKDGQSIIVNANNYDIYEIDPKTGEKGNLLIEDGNGHAMSLVGINENGELIVSSWGRKCIVDISNSDCKYIVYDITSQLDREF